MGYVLTGNSLARQVGYNFSTYDEDNDIYPGSCSASYGGYGGWWFSNCFDCNLNGQYLGGPHTSWANGVEWKTWTGMQYSLQFSEMKIRPDYLGF
jgi:ficolin